LIFDNVIVTPQTTVDAPKPARFYSAAQMNGSQVIAHNTSVNIIYGNVTENDGSGAYNSTSGVYTVPEDGRYYVKGSLALTASVDTDLRLRILKNSSAVVEDIQDVLANHNYTVAGFVNAIQGDTIQIQVVQRNTGSASRTSVNGGRSVFHVAQIQSNQSAVLSNKEMLNQTASARFYLSADQAVATTGQHVAEYDSVSFNYGGVFSLNTSTGEITVNKKCRAQANINIRVNDYIAERNIFKLQINGVAQAVLDTNVVSNEDNVMADILDLKKGDVITVAVDSITDTSYNIRGDVSGVITFIGLVELPDFSVYSTYGEYEVKSTESSTWTGTGANNADIYAQHTGNSLTLTPGTWKLTGSGVFSNNGSSAGYNAIFLRWSTANGNNTTTTPGSLSFDHGRDGGATGGNNFNGTYMEITISQGILTVTEDTTVYLNSISNASTLSNARITVYAEAERLR